MAWRRCGSRPVLFRIRGDNCGIWLRTPPGITAVQIPPGILEPGTEYKLEVIVNEAGRNRTISESCFLTEEPAKQRCRATAGLLTHQVGPGGLVSLDL